MNGYARINAVGFTLLWPWAAAGMVWAWSLGRIDWPWLVAGAGSAQLALAAAQWRLLRTGRWFRAGFALVAASVPAMLVGALAELAMKYGQAVLSPQLWAGLHPFSVSSPWFLLMAGPLLLPPLHLALLGARVTHPVLHGLAGTAVIAAVTAGLFRAAGVDFAAPVFTGALSATAAAGTAYALFMHDGLQPRRG